MESLEARQLLHAGHDHGKKDDNKKHKKYKKYKKSKHSHGYGHDHDHGHHHHHHGDDGAHASGGYDSHRHHPRNW